MPTDAPRTPRLPDPPFPYLRFAKAHFNVDGPLHLSHSGTQRPPAPGVPPLPTPWPGEPLKAALGARYGLGPEHVHLTSGSSSANFLVYLTLARGGRVVAERPAYEALHCLAPIVGAELTFVERPPEQAWRLDPGSLERALEGGADLIAVTDLHNPSGGMLSDDEYSLLIDAAESVDAYVLVDEVYLDYVDAPRPSAATRHPRIVATNSLTKAHGLGDLRAGWILAQPELIERMDCIDDLVNPGLPPIAMEAARRYLEEAEPHLEATRALARARTAQVDAWVQTTQGAHWQPPAGGLTGFVFLEGPEGPLDGDRVVQRLLDEHNVQAVPGSYFQLPGGVRISYGLEEDVLARGLDALAQVMRSEGG